MLSIDIFGTFKDFFQVKTTKTELMIVFDDFESRYLWRTCLNYVTKTLGISRFSFHDSDETNIANPLTTTIKNAELERFLECLKPHLRKTKICTLSMHNCSQEILHLFSAFTNRKSISSLDFAFEEFEKIHK